MMQNDAVVIIVGRDKERGLTSHARRDQHLVYPDFWVDYSTLMKAILLFDELHFMDRPSMMFGAGADQLGAIGAASPLRQYEASFREAGVPLFVHPAPMGPVPDEWYKIKADVNDSEFLRRFQSGLKTSPVFRNLQIARGSYGEFGDQDSVAQRMIALDLSADLKTHESPMALFQDPAIRPMDLSNTAGCGKNLIFEAMVTPQKTGEPSKKHCAVGTIHYENADRNAPTGTIIYFKASLTGDESTDVKNYKTTHNSFPHESTIDQWFSESQFESYGKLGYHAVTSSMRMPHLITLGSPLAHAALLFRGDLKARQRERELPDKSAQALDRGDRGCRVAPLWSGNWTGT
jgi:hypothetical protein